MADFARLTADEVLGFHKTLSNWGRFGERDQLGALNLITPEKRVAAAGLVRTGRSVSCARSLPTQPGPENPSPVLHHMIGTVVRARRIGRDRGLDPGLGQDDQGLGIQRLDEVVAFVHVIGIRLGEEAVVQVYFDGQRMRG